jgi:hypothetical protein
MAQLWKLRSFIDATSIHFSLSILSLISSLSTSSHVHSLPKTINAEESSSTPISSSRLVHSVALSPATDYTMNVTDECRPLFNAIIWPIYMGGGKTPEFSELQYRVYLKAYATHHDTLEFLKTPLLRNVEPIEIYDRGRNRGFKAKLSGQQMCDIYALPIVCYFQG